MAVPSDNLGHAGSYLDAISRGVTGEALAAFFTPDVLQKEFPNRLVPQGAQRDLAAILEAAERGQKVMSAQRYELVHAVASGNDVALEVRWTGTLAVAFGSVPAGGELRARFAVFLEFRDGKIVRQRNYDCFDPW